jgi:hypothetical protein
MALVKCKECGEQVSTSAKSCPKCGAKPPKKTSMITWAVGFFLVCAVYAAVRAPSSTTNSAPSSSTSSSALASVAAPPERPQWAVQTSVDKMTGKAKVFAVSPTVTSTEAMGSPYGNVKAWMGIGCDGKDEWAYVGFSTAPNLTDTETKSGYSEIKTRIKWDNTLQNVALNQEWGSKFLNFDDMKQTISKITKSNEALLELNWYGQNHPHFSFSMDGAAASVTAMRKQCSGTST